MHLEIKSNMEFMEMSENLSISDIIKRAGGPEAIAARANGKLSRWAVYKWPSNGIPASHWPILIELAKVTANELLAANVAARSAAEPEAAA